MIVFLISGIWHGAYWTFILWGILHGLFNIFDRIIEKKNIKIFEPARWIITFIVINFLWLLFRADSVQQWLSILIRIFSFDNTSISSGLLNIFVLPEAAFLCKFIPFIRIVNEHIRGFMMLVFIFSSFAICFLLENNYKTLEKLTTVNMLLSASSLIWGITCLSSESVFVYFNF